MEHFGLPAEPPEHPGAPPAKVAKPTPINELTDVELIKKTREKHILVTNMFDEVDKNYFRHISNFIDKIIENIKVTEINEILTSLSGEIENINNKYQSTKTQMHNIEKEIIDKFDKLKTEIERRKIQIMISDINLTEKKEKFSTSLKDRKEDTATNLYQTLSRIFLEIIAKKNYEYFKKTEDYNNLKMNIQRNIKQENRKVTMLRELNEPNFINSIITGDIEQLRNALYIYKNIIKLNENITNLYSNIVSFYGKMDYIERTITRINTQKPSIEEMKPIWQGNHDILSGYDEEIKNSFDNNSTDGYFIQYNGGLIFFTIHQANIIYNSLKATEAAINQQISNNNINNLDLINIMPSRNQELDDETKKLDEIKKNITDDVIKKYYRPFLEQTRSNLASPQNKPTQNIWSALISKRFIRDKIALLGAQQRTVEFRNLLNRWFANSKTRTNRDEISALEQLPPNISPLDRNYLLYYPVTNYGIVITRNSYTRPNPNENPPIIGGLYLNAKFTNITNAEARQAQYTQAATPLNVRLAEINATLGPLITERNALRQQKDQLKQIRLTRHLITTERVTLNAAERRLEQIRVALGPFRNQKANIDDQLTAMQGNNIDESSKYMEYSPNNFTDLHISIHPGAHQDQSHITFKINDAKRSIIMLFILIDNEIKIVNKIIASETIVEYITGTDFNPANDYHISLRNPIIHFLRGFEKYLTYIRQEQGNIPVNPDEEPPYSTSINEISYNKYLKYKNKYLNLKKLFDKLSIS
jgi:hypothetical protein